MLARGVECARSKFYQVRRDDDDDDDCANRNCLTPRGRAQQCQTQTEMEMLMRG